MDNASEYTNDPHTKFSEPPIGYINVRRREPRPSRAAVDMHQSEEEDELSKDEPLERSQPAQERFSLAGPEPHVYLAAPSRDGTARFARAPSSSGFARARGGAPGPSLYDPPRGSQRRDSAVTASESSFMSAASPSAGFDAGRQQSIQSDTNTADMPYRRPGKHRVGESPTPEEYIALPPEAKKKVDNRLSARRSRAKRKEHVHVLNAQISEQQNTIEMLRIENKNLNDHIANLSRAGYSLHPPPFQPGLAHHPSPHLRHVPPPNHMHPGARHLPPTLPPLMPSGSPRRSHLMASPTLSSHASASGLVVAAGPPTGPGHVPILAHHDRSDASGSYAAQGQSGARYDSPGRGTKREVDDERDDRLRSRMRYTSPERPHWDDARRMSQSSYRSRPSERSRYPKPSARDYTRSPSPRWTHLPPSLAASQPRATDYDPEEEVADGRTPIQISGQGSVSDRLATLIRVHKRAIVTYRATRQGELSEREQRMEGVLCAAEAIGKEVEELNDEFRFVAQVQT